MPKLSAAICALLLTGSPALSATSYTGTFDVDGEGQGDIVLSGYPNSTSFSFFFTTTAPIIEGIGQYTYETAFDDYFDGSSISYGGDNSPTYDVFSIPNTYYQTALITPQGYNLYYPDGDLMERDYFYADDVSVDILAPPRYAGASFTFGISAIVSVPEPATWSMMLAGFLGVGALSRRRARMTSAFA